MVASPVRADDEGSDSQSTIAGKISRKKKKREAQVEEAKKVEKVAAAPAAPAAQESGGGFSLPTISFSIPNNFEAPKTPAEVKPADSEAAPVKPFKVRGVKTPIPWEEIRNGTS
jgi:hypothetical protein